MPLHMEDILRLLAACAAGGLIGFERELHDKPAGFRTNIMICLGAALFTVLSIRIPEAYLAAHNESILQRFADPTRIAAQIVTGVGFLGAGAIMQSRGSVVGLTTAATIWTVASVGMAFGAGAFGIGLAATVMAGAVLFGLDHIESTIALWHTTFRLHIKTDSSREGVELVERCIADSGLRCSTKRLQKTFDGFSFDLELIGPEDKIDEQQNRIMYDEHIRSLKRT